MEAGTVPDEPKLHFAVLNAGDENLKHRGETMMRPRLRKLGREALAELSERDGGVRSKESL